MLNSILTTEETVLTIESFLICTGAMLLFGLVLAGIHMYRNQYSKNFILTLTLLPVIVQTIIMLVNGNLGTGVAVMGAFSLVRFRSAPGNAREIGSLFFGMALGLAGGMGYIGIGALLLVLVGTATIILVTIPFGVPKSIYKSLKITIPENLDYYGIFDDIFETYTKKATLLSVKTVNMGSLYELRYEIELKNEESEKAFIDELRVRNGNLTIVCGRIPSGKEEL
ncbi:MAG: DUF4956 domain-containing protein [Lachnospiraceae bacterium]|nr:DUF4956 domain-containing protein [Lachnospiraceae bacterium]